MEHTYIDKETIKLFHSENFICFGLERNSLIIRKVDKHNAFHPKFGWLMFDVNIVKNLVSGAVTLTGKKYKIFKPKSNILNMWSVITEPELESINNLQDGDVKLRIGKYVLIKRQYYYLKEIETVSRCFLDTPIIVLNCGNEKEIING